MLILFDIDGTLLRSQRAGLKAMRDAVEELFGSSVGFDGIEVSGRLDPLIWHDFAVANGIDDPAAHHDRFRATYARHLEDRFRREPTVHALPGVADLLAALRRDSAVTLGLLTGNYPETGRLKITSAGLDYDVFTVHAWGSEGGSRRELPPVAIGRHEARTGREIARRDVVIIGDTPHDIDCAHANGCRAVAVATGMFGLDELATHGPELAVEDLSGVDDLVEWIATGREP